MTAWVCFAGAVAFWLLIAEFCLHHRLTCSGCGVMCQGSFGVVKQHVFFMVYFFMIHGGSSAAASSFFQLLLLLVLV